MLIANSQEPILTKTAYFDVLTSFKKLPHSIKANPKLVFYLLIKSQHLGKVPFFYQPTCCKHTEKCKTHHTDKTSHVPGDEINTVQICYIPQNQESIHFYTSVKKVCLLQKYAFNIQHLKLSSLVRSSLEDFARNCY